MPASQGFSCLNWCYSNAQWNLNWCELAVFYLFNTSEVLYHSLSERDLQIAHWKQETEALKKSYSLTTGLVTSLQKDITSKDHNIQQLKTEVEKFRRESREKDNQLAQVSDLCLCFLHTKKNPWDKGWCDFLQLILPTSLWCLQQISELELQVKRYKEDINKFRTEHGMLTNKLAEKTKLLQKQPRILCGEMSLHCCFKIRMTHTHVCVGLLLLSLFSCQDFLGTSYCSSSLRKEICNLQNLCLTPPALGVQTSTAGVLCSLLGWVDAVECLLRDVGLDVSGSEKGSLFQPCVF
uniref:Uncharacterized protein n=1 Tax=Podarcis muralis TaxID=64176 RepID=A0A670J7D9_PODMU